MYTDNQESMISNTEWRNDSGEKMVFCFTFSLSLYNDLKVLKTGGQPLLKFILRNLSKHSLNFSPWKKKNLLICIYPDNSKIHTSILTCTLIYLKPRKQTVNPNITFIPLQLLSPDKKFNGSLLGTSPLGYLVQASS